MTLMPQLLDERIEGDEHLLSLYVPNDLAHLPGHFPGAPVVPGVVQVGWALALAAPRLGTPAHCRNMEALKFQQLLGPGDTVELHLRADHARGKLYFAYRQGTINYSSGRLVWSKDA